MKKAKKFKKPPGLDSIRAHIEQLFDDMDRAYHQIEDDSELYGSIGEYATQAGTIWHSAQPHIDSYNKPMLIVGCVTMAESLAELHSLCSIYYDDKNNIRAYGLMVGWEVVHSWLSHLADELDLPNEFEKCWPPGSNC